MVSTCFNSLKVDTRYGQQVRDMQSETRQSGRWVIAWYVSVEKCVEPVEPNFWQALYLVDFGWFWLTNFSKFYSFWLWLFRTIGFAYITHVHELLAQFNPMISQNRTKWVGRALIQLPSGNQTWLAGQSPMIFPRLAASPFSSGFRSQPRLITGCSASWKPLDLIENGRIWLLIHQQLHLTPARRC